MVQEILHKFNIPDKPQFFATTSHKFKEDIYSYFYPSKDKTFIEFGTSRGYTSAFASEIFKHVHTINIKNTIESREYLNDIPNVTQYILDLANTPGEAILEATGRGDVFMIDADHSFDAVVRDTATAIHLANKDSYIIYDDYGGYSTVKKAVQFLVKANLIEVVEYIGQEKDYTFGESTLDLNRCLNDREGVICRIL